MNVLTRWTILSLLFIGLCPLGGCQGGDRHAPFMDDSLVAYPRTTTDEPTETTSTQTAQFLIDGMVGQISGQPIYADTIFHGDDPLHDQLAAMGRRDGPQVFRQRARELITSKLRSMMLDALILAEAERSLSDREREGLRRVMQKQREHLVRLFGEGSESLARHNMYERTGRSLEAAMEDFRRRIVVQRHVNATIEPLINITRRDIERYYRQNIEQFNPPAKRVVRLIHLASEEQAQEVAQRLASEEPFAAVADTSANRYPSSGGLFPEAEGDAPFAYAQLNEAMVTLDVGEFAGPLSIQDDYWFIYLESIDAPPARSLLDAQKEIEQALVYQAQRRETDRYYRRLLAATDHENLARMTDALIDIAVSRYAVVEDAGTLAPNR